MRSLQSQAEKGARVTEFTFCANTARGTLQAYLGGGGSLVVCLMLVIPSTVAVRLLCPWDFPGKNTGVGCRFLLQAYLKPCETTSEVAA